MAAILDNKKPTIYKIKNVEKSLGLIKISQLFMKMKISINSSALALVSGLKVASNIFCWGALKKDKH